VNRLTKHIALGLIASSLALASCGGPEGERESFASRQTGAPPYDSSDGAAGSSYGYSSHGYGGFHYFGGHGDRSGTTYAGRGGSTFGGSARGGFGASAHGGGS
jgi:hypothetical protein